MNYTQLRDSIREYTQNYEDIFVDSIPSFIRQAEKRIYNTVQLPAQRKNVTGSVTTGNPYLSLPTDWLSAYSLAVMDAPSGGYEYLLDKDVNYIRQAFPYPATSGTPSHYAVFDQNTLILGPTPDDNYQVEMHYNAYPTSIVQGAIITFGAITGGSGYTNGTYLSVPLTGGTGTGCIATITISGGAVTGVNITNPGSLYIIGDTLTASLGSGSNFAVTVTNISNANGTSWLGDNFDMVLLYGSLVEAYTFMKGEQDVMAFYQARYQEALMQLKRLGDGLDRQDAYRSGQARVEVK